MDATECIQGTGVTWEAMGTKHKNTETNRINTEKLNTDKTWNMKRWCNSFPL